ncbi:cytochrome c [Inquilinus sp. KBS0705]|nr:cytochrome c [Inquilinus sp. KBS0705]
MKFKLIGVVLGLVCISACTEAQTRHKAKVSVKPNAAGGLATSIANGKKVYMQYCLTCHQADGGGVQRMNPPLIKTEYVLGDKKRLIGIVLKGFSEDVEINGEYYSNTMPAHDFLKDQEIADVLTYVRNSFGNKAAAVKVTEVTKTRAAK